ncbi:MAG: hypothetical protein RQ966_12875 [Acetobacteraceae bacterium]|nr:hypothetical protein [Acetobacteraceae bacterium]
MDARLDTILVAGRPLLAEDVEFLAGQLGEPPWRARRRRLDARDAAVRDLARRLCPAAPPTAAARIVEGALSGYLATRWRWERALDALPEGSAPVDVALHRLARLNGGLGIGRRRLYDLLASCPGCGDAEKTA